MPTDQEILNKEFQKDIIDLKIKVGIHDSDISTIKRTLDTINKNLTKVLWTVVSTSGSLVVGVIIVIVSYYLNKK